MKRAGKMLVIGLFSLLLSGCMFTTPETSLYRLPKLAGEYESLESQIDALLTNGAEYAAPTSGSNLQSVQMIDLDGDGSEEAVAFFRRASDKKPMKIYIFKADGDSYERYAVIEGASSQIYSVNYADLDGDGLKEILVGYKSSSDVQGLAIYPLSPGTSESLLTTGYSRYANLDMNGDGKNDLCFYSKSHPKSGSNQAGVSYVEVTAEEGDNVTTYGVNKDNCLVYILDREWADYKYLYPVPKNAIDINPNLRPQNPGWDD